MTSRFAVTGALLLLAACEQAATDKEGGSDGDGVTDTVYQVSPDDEEMNAARRRAIAGLPEFYARLADPAADESEFMVKFDILPGEDNEYVWAEGLDRSSTPMTGILLNQPEETEHVLGQRVPIPEADVIDWSYRKGRVVQGGFTSRALLRHMPPDQAAAMRNQLGW